MTGNIRLTNADCAEEFDVSSTTSIESGTVMVINKAGNLDQSHQAYDKKVAGRVFGAGNYKPGIGTEPIVSVQRRGTEMYFLLPLQLMISDASSENQLM